MAVTFTSTVRNVEGALRREVGTLAFDSSYPTGGEALTPATLGGLVAVKDIRIGPSGGYSFEWDGANNKVKAFWGDNNNASDAPSVEVDDTTDLSALTAVPVSALGY